MAKNGPGKDFLAQLYQDLCFAKFYNFIFNYEIGWDWPMK